MKYKKIPKYIAALILLGLCIMFYKEYQNRKERSEYAKFTIGKTFDKYRTAKSGIIVKYVYFVNGHKFIWFNNYEKGVVWGQ